MNKTKKWTEEDTNNAIDWSIKLQQSVIDYAKKKFVELTNLLEANPENVDLQQAISAQESRIIKLEAKLTRFINSIPELLEA